MEGGLSFTPGILPFALRAGFAVRAAPAAQWGLLSGHAEKITRPPQVDETLLLYKFYQYRKLQRDHRGRVDHLLREVSPRLFRGSYPNRSVLLSLGNNHWVDRYRAGRSRARLEP